MSRQKQKGLLEFGGLLGAADEEHEGGNAPTLSDVALLLENSNKQVAFITKGVAVVCSAIAEQSKVYKKAGVPSSLIKLLDLVGNIGNVMAQKALEMDNGEAPFDDSDTHELFAQAAVLRRLVNTNEPGDKSTDDDDGGVSVMRAVGSGKKRTVNDTTASRQRSTRKRKASSSDESGGTSPNRKDDSIEEQLIANATAIDCNSSSSSLQRVDKCGEKVADTSVSFKTVGNMAAYAIIGQSGTILALVKDDLPIKPTAKMKKAAVSDANQKGTDDEQREDYNVAGAAMAAFMTSLIANLVENAPRPIVVAGLWDANAEAESVTGFVEAQAPFLRSLLRFAATTLGLRANGDASFLLASCRAAVRDVNRYLRQLATEKSVGRKPTNARGKSGGKTAKANQPLLDM